MSVGNKTALQLSIAGAIGGIAEAMAVQPLDMIKTRFHLNTAGRNPSVLSAFRSIYAEGGVLRFYRGILPEITGMVPKSALMYLSNEMTKRWLTQLNGGVVDTKVAFAAGFASGYPEALSVAPFQVIKVRLQAKEHLGRYQNSFDCVQKVIRDEGFRALFIGFGPTCWRNCVWNCVYFGLMYRLKGWLPASTNRWVDLSQTLLTGTIAGLIATCFNAPFDNVKSRFQSELRLPGKKPVHRFTLLTLYRIAQTEGLRSIYKGLAPKALRMGLGGGVGMAAFELTCVLMPDAPRTES